ncbi:MAG TPA: hypothetical protein V6C57_28055 [Coleofasciculaceae cyanobacterium]
MPLLTQENVKRFDPIEIGTRSDGVKAIAVGKSPDYENSIVVALQDDEGFEPDLYLLPQLLKFAGPDDWKWDEEALDKVEAIGV